MSFTIVNPPAGALPGKTYALHGPSNLLVMNTPSLDDLFACRGFLLTTTTGWVYYVGRAFVDLRARIEQRLGRPIAALIDFTSAPELLSEARYRALWTQVGGSTGVRMRLAQTSVDAPLPFSAIYAVPHRCVTGHGSSNSTFALLDVYGTPNGNVNLGSYNDGIVHGAGAQGTSGYSPFESIGFVMGLIASGLTYGEFINKAATGMDNDGGIRDIAVANVIGLLQERGIDPHTKVALPILYFSNGRLAFDMVNRAPLFGPSSGRTGTDMAGAPGDVGPAWHGGRLKFGDGDYRTLPFTSCAQFTSAVGSVYKGYVNPVTGAPASFAEATIPFKSTLGSLETRGLTGHQPFGCFYDIVTGDYTPKTLDNYSLSDEDYFKWMRFGFDSNAAAATTDNLSEAQLQTLGGTLTGNLATSGGRDAHTGQTVADTWMITPRVLLRLLWDPISVEGSSGTWSREKALRILDTQPTNA